MRATEHVERDRVQRESAGSTARADGPRPPSRRTLLVSFLVLVALFWAGVLFLLA